MREVSIFQLVWLDYQRLDKGLVLLRCAAVVALQASPLRRFARPSTSR
jgi:hypothetical protein